MIVVLVGFPNAADAQSHGYGFAGTTIGNGSIENAFRYGVGGGWAIAPYVTAGGEIGGVQKDGVGAVISGNIGVHFKRRVATGFDPFVTGGIAGAHFGGENALFANVGGGVNYWFGPRVGLRTEFRGYIVGRDVNSFADLRIGISFR